MALFYFSYNPAIYEITDISYIYAINEDGSVKWRFPYGGRGNVLSLGVIAPIVTDKDGNIVACPNNGYCYGIAPDGTMLWEYDMGVLAEGGPLSTRTAPLLVADGLIWILDATGVIHALADPNVFFDHRSYLPLMSR